MTKDFFISYNSADRQWAEWIAYVLEEHGYSAIIQAWDFRPGGNFMVPDTLVKNYALSVQGFSIIHSGFVFPSAFGLVRKLGLSVPSRTYVLSVHSG